MRPLWVSCFYRIIPIYNLWGTITCSYARTEALPFFIHEFLEAFFFFSAVNMDYFFLPCFFSSLVLLLFFGDLYYLDGTASIHSVALLPCCFLSFFFFL